MPRKDHGKGRRFKKGQPTANPTGARGKNPEKTKQKKILKKLLREDFTLAIEMVTQSTASELKALAENPNTPIDKVIMAAALMKSVKNGDVSQLIQLAEIVIGKPKETHEHVVKNPYEQMTDTQLDDEIKKLESNTTQIGERDVTPKPEDKKNTTS
jgi:hypothetical protein